MTRQSHHSHGGGGGIHNVGRQVCLLILGLVIGLRIFIWQGSKSFKVRIATSTNTLKLTELPYGEKDDLRYGKYCIYNPATGWLASWIGKNPWNCKECKHGVCRPLQRKGRCRPFSRKEIDSVPRIYSEWSPYTYQKSHTLVYHHDGHSEYAQKQTPHCSGTLSKPCFDLKRCPRFGPLKVFPYGKTMEQRLDIAINNTISGTLRKVDSEAEACLLVVGPDSFQTPNQLFKQNSWWNGGQNHYIFYSAEFFGTHGDRPFNSAVNFGMAATSQWSLDDAFLREGYDTPLGLYPKEWKRPQQYRELRLHRPRRLLLSFKGNIYSWEQHNWQHRWIASEYWKDEPDIYVDTKCKGHDYKDSYDVESYGELLMNSTFVFCPGGGGTDSYRFVESLDAGAIPVVTSDFVPPFYPDIDWSGCIVQVSEARVVDIPNFVRDISDEQIQIRQKNCARLHAKVYGDDSVQTQFTIAMQIWAIRIKNALHKKFEVTDIVLEEMA